MLLSKKSKSSKRTYSNQLFMADAILLILDALEKGEPPCIAERALLEGIASIARLPHFDDDPCPVLATFKRDDDWLLYMHQSFAYLQTMDRIERIPAGFTLTFYGKRELEDILEAWDGDQEETYTRMRILVSKVRDGLWLDAGLK